MNSYYGFTQNLKFSEVWDKAEDFVSDFKNSPLYNGVQDQRLTQLFYLLYAKYGESHIAFNSTEIFKYNVYSIIYSKGKKWEKSLELQNKLDSLPEDEILRGTIAVYNNSDNPSESGMVEGEKFEMQGFLATYVNHQNSTQYKKNKLDAYMDYMSTLKDVSSSFVNEFSKLFLKFVRPIYETYFVDERSE